MSATQPRPRIVDAAFAVWLGAATLLILFGLLLALSQSHVPAFFRGAGILFVLAGMALGYLAGRTRRGDRRFRRAAVAFSLAMVVLLALFSVISRGLIWLLIMILAMVGAVLLMRPGAQQWFDASAQQDGPNG
jgi:peptidoglycan/LPS O-acetylase OafA/YrhL